MAESRPADKLSLTLSLSPDIARRLVQAAEAQKRPVADFVLDLLDRNLPRGDGGQKKNKIPYT
jgi:uncharacterized protein (DUF1778 family)